MHREKLPSVFRLLGMHRWQSSGLHRVTHYDAKASDLGLVDLFAQRLDATQRCGRDRIATNDVPGVDAPVDEMYGAADGISRQPTPFRNIHPPIPGQYPHV